jgi:hypothetical protein
MAYYVFDDAKNLFEGMTKEEIVNAIAAATGLTPEQIDADVITSAIKEQNAQKNVNLWIGTQNEYNAIQQPDENTLYCVTDPHETNELQSQINQLQAEVNELVVQNTENASGYIVGSQTANAESDITTDPHTTYFRKTFTVPENAVILDVSWVHGIIIFEEIPAGAYRYDALNITRTNATTVNVVINVRDIADGETDYDSLVFRISYAYSEAIDLSELTDIRVGYDGTVYGSAGEAVRKQAFNTRFHDYIKQALLNLLAHVAYTDQNGQQYYNALERAMYMTAGVTSITAGFDQGQNVIYDTDDLESLRQYLTVTAYYEDNTREVITEYTLSGTLEAGTSTITVSYGGKSTTFEVSVTAWDFKWDASSKQVPSGMTYQSYDFTTEQGSMYVVEPQLHFNYYGDALLEIECRWGDTTVTGGNDFNPQLSVQSADKYGAKLYPTQYNASLSTNVTTTTTNTQKNPKEYHKIRLQLKSGVYTLQIDDDEWSGSGVENNNYLGPVGLSSGTNHSPFPLYIKSIRWKQL